MNGKSINDTESYVILSVATVNLTKVLTFGDVTMLNG